MSRDLIQKIFEEIIGKPCWHVQHGFASFLTFEFGTPHLETFEMEGRRRHVNVRGEWHLWIHSCGWKAFDGDDLITTSEGEEPLLERAAAILDSQILTAVEVDPDTAATVFRFDLGGRLETMPLGDEDEESEAEQWMFYRPNGDVLTLRADCTWRLVPANEETDENVWRPLRAN